MAKFDKLRNVVFLNKVTNSDEDMNKFSLTSVNSFDDPVTYTVGINKYCFIILMFVFSIAREKNNQSKTIENKKLTWWNAEE